MFLSSAPPPQEQIINLPLGAHGTRATLKHMARLVAQSRYDPRIRAIAKDITMHCLPGDYRAEAEECLNYVRDNIRYLQDPNGMERLVNPIDLLTERAGDCDDQATLLASLLESIGHPCRFVAVGYTTPGDFEHVYTETRIGNKWVPAETTMSMPLGWAPVPPMTDTPPVCVMVQHI